MMMTKMYLSVYYKLTASRPRVGLRLGKVRAILNNAKPLVLDLSLEGPDKAAYLLLHGGYR